MNKTELARDNERLREALKQVTRLRFGSDKSSGMIFRAKAIARKALGRTK